MSSKNVYIKINFGGIDIESMKLSGLVHVKNHCHKVVNSV